MLPTSLEVLNLAGDDPTYWATGNSHEFTGGIPPEWGALTNLKELKMAHCGLDGKPLSIRTERHQLASNLTLSCTGVIPAELRQLVNLTKLWLQGNQLTGESSAPVPSGFYFR